MSAAFSSPSHVPDESLAFDSHSPAQSSAPPTHASLHEPEPEDADAALSASVMSIQTEQQIAPSRLSQAVAPGTISEQGSSSHEDSADVVMEGTAEPEDPPLPVAGDAAQASSSQGGSASSSTDETGQQTSDNPQARSRPFGDDQASTEEDDSDSSDGDDDNASHASEDYEHRFFMETFKEDNDSPSSEELAEMKRRERDSISALNEDHWVKQCFTQLPAGADPEYEIIPTVHKLEWTMTPYHGTKETPNKDQFTRSPPLNVTNHDGQEYSFGLKVFPHGNDGTEMLSVYLECFPSGSQPGTVQGSDDGAFDAADAKSQTWWEVTAQVGCVVYNPDCTTIHASQKAAHQFTSINPDFGWTRFTGPWVELHKRKHLQPRPLLQNDRLSFVVYIRLVRDPTRALWWHNVREHRNDWDPVLKTGYRGYHIDNMPSGYAAVISALAIWFELPSFRDLVESAPSFEPYQQPLDTYQLLLTALKTVLQEKLASRKARPSARVTYLTPVTFALAKYGYSSFHSPFEVWSILMRILKDETSEAVRRGHGSADQLESFLNSIKILQYTPELSLPSCAELGVASNPGISTPNNPTPAPSLMQDIVSAEAVSGDAVRSTILHIELPRQTYDASRRCWKKVNTKIDLDEVLQSSGRKYQLFGLISHSGELGSLRFNPVMRPRGPGTQWYRWSTRCHHTTRGYVVPQTSKQAVDSLQGTGSSSTVAFAAVYIETLALKSMLESQHDREPHDVFNTLAVQPAPSTEQPDTFYVAVHMSSKFSTYRHDIGFLDPWSQGDNDLVLQVARHDTILDLRRQIRTMDKFQGRHFILYRLLLANQNHRFDAQVKEEKLESPLFMPTPVSKYGLHFILHLLPEEHVASAKAQDEELNILLHGSQDARKDMLIQSAKAILKKCRLVHGVSGLDSTSGSAPHDGVSELTSPFSPATAGVSAAEITIAANNVTDVVMSGTDELEGSNSELFGAIPPPPPPPPPPPLPINDHSEHPAGPVGQAKAVSDKNKNDGKATTALNATGDETELAQELLTTITSGGKSLVELICVSSKSGIDLLKKRMGRELEGGQATACFAARYSGENTLHFFSLAKDRDGYVGPRAAGFAVLNREDAAPIETPQEPRDHSLVFVKHYWPSKGPLLEAAGALLVSRDSVLKDALKRPSSTNEINYFVEQPGEAPLKLQKEISLKDNKILTGCVLLTDPVMPDSMATILTKRGLPASVTDYLKPVKGFSTGFGRGWASCETLHGRAHGKGRVIYPDGDAYEGEFRSGRRQGTGTMYYATGNSYHGEWSENVPHGNGTIVYAETANRYVGPFVSGRPHGDGGVTYWKKAEAGARICRVCLEGEMNSVLIPCGHMVVCMDCGSQLGECPVCRGGIDRIQRVWDCSQS